MNAIRIMRPIPEIECDGGEPIEVPGQPGLLLRLLAIRAGKFVTKDDIADIKGTDPASAPSKIRDLRKFCKARFPDSKHIKTLIKTGRGGYSIDPSIWSIDAAAFEQRAAQIKKADLHPQLTVSKDQAQSAITELASMLAQWQKNPATGLDQKFQAFYVDLRRRATDRQLLLQLHSQDESYIREAILELTARTRDEPDGSDWALLLKAHASLNNRDRIERTMEDLRSWSKRHKCPVPDVLTKLYSDLQDDARRQKLLFPVDTDMPTNALMIGSVDNGELAEVIKLLGISTASRMHLAGTKLRPIDSIKRTRHRLRFSGILASKWVTEPAIRKAFSNLLERLDDDGGEVRFLILHPDHNGYRRLQDLRDGAISSEHVPHLIELAKAHKCMQLRGFDELPAFRILIIDDDLVSFSPYRLAASEYAKTDFGYKSPHVVLNPLAEYPLADAFQLLFDETWARAHNME